MALTLNRSILKDEGRGERGREGRGNTKNGRPRFTKPRSAHTFLSFATCNLQHFLQRGEQMDHKAKHYSWQIFKQLQAHTADRCTQIYNCKRFFFCFFFCFSFPLEIFYSISHLQAATSNTIAVQGILSTWQSRVCGTQQSTAALQFVLHTHTMQILKKTHRR